MKPEIEFIRRMTALFGPPDEATAPDVMHEYSNALRGQNAATLSRAADIIARERRIRAWPTVAECLDAVKAARRTVNTVAMGLEPIDDFDGWWAERLARIHTATNERQIGAEIAEIEPYAIARWIADSRLSEAHAAAEGVRRQWKSKASDEIAQRRTGDRT